MSKLIGLDRITIGYHLFVLVLFGPRAFQLHSNVAHFLLNILGLFTPLVFVYVIKKNSSRLLTFLRQAYPLFYFLPIYEQVGRINRLWCPFEWDGLFSVCDRFVFDFLPSQAWIKAWPFPWLSEIFHISYFSFYVQFVFLAFLIEFRVRTRSLLYPYLLALCSAFYACNIVFLFMPALGPQSFSTEIHQSPGYLFNHIMDLIYQFEISGGHFPSAHVALTIVVFLTSIRLKIYRWLFLPLGIVLVLSTVYCGYHYVIDVFGGIIVGALTYYIVQSLAYKSYAHEFRA